MNGNEQLETVKLHMLKLMQVCWSDDVIEVDSRREALMLRCSLSPDTVYKSGSIARVNLTIETAYCTAADQLAVTVSRDGLFSGRAA